VAACIFSALAKFEEQYALKTQPHSTEFPPKSSIRMLSESAQILIGYCKEDQNSTDNLLQEVQKQLRDSINLRLLVKVDIFPVSQHTNNNNSPTKIQPHPIITEIPPHTEVSPSFEDNNTEITTTQQQVEPPLTQPLPLSILCSLSLEV
jgi:hypothetical protein